MFEGKQNLPELTSWTQGAQQSSGSQQQQRQPLQKSLPARKPLRSEGEQIRVLWPPGANVQKFGGRYEITSFHYLQDLAQSLGISFVMRGLSKDQKKRKTNSLENVHKPSEHYIVQISGPVGSVRNFYAHVRLLMAAKRGSWKGLLHPRKVTLCWLSPEGKGVVANEATAASPLPAEPPRDFDEEADSGDDAAPSEEFVKQACQRMVGTCAADVRPRRETDEMATSSEFPNQNEELDPAMVTGIGELLIRAHAYLEVVMRTASRGRKRPSACDRHGCAHSSEQANKL